MLRRVCRINGTMLHHYACRLPPQTTTNTNGQIAPNCGELILPPKVLDSPAGFYLSPLHEHGMRIPAKLWIFGVRRKKPKRHSKKPCFDRGQHGHTLKHSILPHQNLL